MMKTKTLKINDLVLDEKFYPRLKVSWKTAYGYAQAMKAGAIFPPITIGLLRGKQYVVDGWHRITAYKQNKEEYIEAEFILFKNKTELFIDAVKRNATHGKPYSVQEKISIINRLQDMKIEKADASKIVGINPERLPQLIQRKTMTLPNGEKIILKASLEKAKTELLRLSEDNDFMIDDMQAGITGNNLSLLLSNLITILELKSYQINNEILSKLAEVKLLIEQMPEMVVLAEQ